MKKVLAILPSKVLYGKERSNIEVYNLLENSNNYNLKIIINKRANSSLKKAVEHLHTSSIIFPERHHLHFRLLRYVWECIFSNIQLFIWIKRFNPDILFMCSELNFYDNYLALKFFRKKIIYRIGDAPAYPKMSFYEYNKYVWSHYVIPRVTTFVCISKFIQESIIKTGRVSKNDTIIYNYPPTRKKSSNNESNKYKVRQSSSIAFGYIGQLIQQKGVDLFVKSAIQVLKHHSECLFYIAGSLSYDKTFSDSIKTLIPDVYRNRIILLDEISDIELFFANIDILCVPSVKQEPLGNVIVEAKKYSVPCIIFPSGGMPELITHGFDGFICREPTSESLQEGMIYYIINKHLIPEHSRNSYDSIITLGIDREKYVNKWMNVFEQLSK